MASMERQRSNCGELKECRLGKHIGVTTDAKPRVRKALGFSKEYDPEGKIVKKAIVLHEGFKQIASYGERSTSP